MIQQVANVKKRVDFIRSLWIYYYFLVIHSHKTHIVMALISVKMNSWVEPLTWLTCSINTGGLQSYSGDMVGSGKHATCYIFCLEREGRLPCDGSGKQERERESFSMMSYFRVGMGPWAAQQAKESWKAIKKKLLSTALHSVNHQLLKRLKTTLFLHVNDAPFICTLEDRKGFKSKAIRVLFFFLLGDRALTVGYTCSTVPYASRAFAKNTVMYSVVKWIPLQKPKSLHIRERYELRLNVKPVPVPGLKSSILSHTFTLCVVDHAINPITKTVMSTGEARATQHNSDV